MVAPAAHDDRSARRGRSLYPATNSLRLYYRLVASRPWPPPRRSPPPRRQSPRRLPNSRTSSPARGSPASSGRGARDPLEPLCRIPGGSGIVRIPDPFANVFLVRSPQHARHVLIANQDAYGKGTDYRVLGVLLGQGLLTNADPVFWQRQRKLIQPMFAKRHLAPMATHMTAAAEDWLHKWEGHATDGGTLVDAHAAMNALTLDVVDRALFGVGVDDATTQIVGGAMTDVLHAGSYYLQTGYITRALMGLGWSSTRR